MHGPLLSRAWSPLPESYLWLNWSEVKWICFRHGCCNTSRVTSLHTFPPQVTSITSLDFTSLDFTPLHFNTSLHFTPLYFTSLHFTSLHMTSLSHSTSLLPTPLYFASLISLHSTLLLFTPLHFTLYYCSLLFSTLHFPSLHCSYPYYLLVISNSFKYNLGQSMETACAPMESKHKTTIFSWNLL